MTAPGATLTEADPDLVGLTDVADILGCTRQNMRRLMVTDLRSLRLSTKGHARSGTWRTF